MSRAMKWRTDPGTNLGTLIWIHCTVHLTASITKHTCFKLFISSVYTTLHVNLSWTGVTVHDPPASLRPELCMHPALALCLSSLRAESCFSWRESVVNQNAPWAAPCLWEKQHFISVTLADSADSQVQLIESLGEKFEPFCPTCSGKTLLVIVAVRSEHV